MQSMESRLALLARKGDSRAFAELVNLYADKLYQLAFRLTGNRQEAEDVVQETFLRVYKHLDRYDETLKFSTWIYRIASNLCIDRLRKRRNVYSLDAQSGEHEDLDGYSMLPGDERTPESEVLLSETQQMVHRAIESLPLKYRTVVVLRYLQDLSLQEIAEVLDVPVTTVKTRVHRAREYMRRKIAPLFRPDGG